MQQINLKIPNGYQIKKRTAVVDIDTAVKILSGKKQRKYTEAVRPDNGPTAKLTRHVLVCPHCGSEVPAYDGYLNPAYKQQHFLYFKISKNVVEEWGTRQLSFFEPKHTKLEFNRVCRPNWKLVCPKCKNGSMPDNKARDVVISRSKNTIKIACEIQGLEEFISLPWISAKQVTLTFPIYEICTFNLRNGHTFIQLSDVDGENVVAKYDITSFPEMFGNGAVFRAISLNVKVSRVLKRMFIEATKAPIVFSNSELKPDKFVLMTQFIGFDRSFYDAVPYVGDSYRVEGSFKRAAINLHTQDRAKKYFERSSIPSIKSTRRLYFNKTGLLFYLPEGEILWEIFHDPNIYCKVMKDAGVYEILSSLRQRPSIAVFLKDYCDEKGAANLAQIILSDWGAAMRYAINYCSMSERMKKQERSIWAKKEIIGKREETTPTFSRPFCQPDQSIADCVIDGFTFFWLRTSRDYLKTSKALDNCLVEWSPENNPVVCVNKGDRAVAAIEVCGRRVVQVQGYSNMSITIERGLPEAYEKWLKTYNLREE